MKTVETSVIVGAMHILATDIKSDDGIANAACKEAALRLVEQDLMIEFLKNENERLEAAIKTTLADNSHLADGDNCTLLLLKQAIKDY